MKNPKTKLTLLSTMAIAVLALGASACASGSQASEASGTTKDANVRPSPAKSENAMAALGTADAAAEAVRAFEQSRLTDAPLRATAVAYLNAPVDEVWDYVSNHDNLIEYGAGSGLKHVEVKRASSGGNGVGCKRECLTNENDRFVEEIVFFRAPHIFAYSAVENTWGLTNHLGVVIVRPTADGGSELEWRQYFNTEKPEMAEMMAKNLGNLLRGPLLGFFVDKFGGAVQEG